jgi:hypothetical protein
VTRSNPAPERPRRGYLKIGDKKYKGEFRMTLKISAGKKKVVVSYDSKIE